MDKVLELMTGAYVCDAASMNTFRLQILTAVKNGTVQAIEDNLEKKSEIKCIVFGMNPGKASVNCVDQWDITDPSIPDNSIAVLFYEGMTFPWKTYNMEQRIAQVAANPKIIGSLLFLNTPGGYIHRIDTLSETIKNSPKPIAAYITGLCCSAGQWLSSPCLKIFSASLMDIHGSIGTMTTWVNDSKFWESMGIEIKDLYSTLSGNKNYRSKAAEEGDFTPIIKELDFYTEIFQKAISQNRNIAIDDKSKVFDGSDFHTAEAIALKLCDQLATLDEALNWVLIEGMKTKSKSI